MRISLSMMFGALVAAGLAAPSAAFADGDAVAGAKVFKKCAACHVATEAKNRVGPHLVGIIDRPDRLGRRLQVLESHDRARGRGSDLDRGKRSTRICATRAAW
jgi:cytochrome c2